MTNTTSPPAIAAVSPPAALNTLSSSICSGVIASACLAPSSFRGGLYGVAGGASFGRDVDDLEREIVARRARWDADTEARRRAAEDLLDSELRRRELSESEMSSAAQSEARARAEEDARARAAMEALEVLEAQNAALLEAEERRRIEFNEEAAQFAIDAAATEMRF